MYRIKSTPDPIFTDVLKLDLASIEPSLAGPKRPQDRVSLKEAKSSFIQAMDKEFNKPSDGGGQRGVRIAIRRSRPHRWTRTRQGRSAWTLSGPRRNHDLGHGDVVIRGHHVLPNTLEPHVMVAAGSCWPARRWPKGSR